MSTIGTIVQAAGRKIGLADMEVEEIVDGISALNMMLSQWQAIPSLKNAITRENFNITNGTASYTVGSGATVDTTWPGRIKAAFLRDDDNVDTPLAVFSAEEYAYTGQKSETQKPAALYYERTYPNGTFFFWPTPDDTYAVHIWSHKIFTTYSATTDSLALPPEYEPAIIFNLAIEMAPEYKKEPSGVVVARAQSTLRSLKNMNSHPVPQANTNVVCRGGTSSKGDFNIDYSARVGYATLPFVLR